VHNQRYLDVMEEYEREYPEDGMEGADGLYDDMYYYDQLGGAPMGVDPNGQFANVDFSGLDAQQRAA